MGQNALDALGIDARELSRSGHVVLPCDSRPVQDPAVQTNLRRGCGHHAVTRRRQGDDLVAAGSDADERDWDPNLDFNESQIVDRQLWQVLSAPSVNGRGAPTGEGLVDRPHPRQAVGTRGDRVNELTVDLIGDADLDGLEDVEDVEECECDVGNAVQSRHMACRNRVEPAGAAGASGRGAVLMSAITDQLTGRIVELSRKWAGTDPGRICLIDANYAIDARRWHSRPLARTCGR